MIPLRDEVLRVLDGIGRKLLDVAGRSWLNAVLVRADASLVLPAPAIGLMRVVSESSRTLPAHGAFRSLAPVREVPDTTLAPITPGWEVHPWRVRTTAWLGDDAAAGWRRGLRVLLDRAPESTAGPGTMTFAVRGSSTFAAAIAHVGAAFEERPLAWARLAAPSADDLALRNGAVHQRVTGVFGCLGRIPLPESWAARTEVAFDLLFERPVRAPVGAPCPEVVGNAIPVWNSLPLRYPAHGAIPQYVSESEARFVHPLDTRELGDHWNAWSIVSVGASGDRRIRFSPAVAPLTDQEEEYKQGRYDLSFGERLAVILSGDARRRLDVAGEHLCVDFRATLGSLANGVPAGSEFQFFEPRSFAYEGAISGQLVGPTWGGCDGLTPGDLTHDDVSLVSALLPAGHERSVDDVASALRVAFGGLLELVDGRDLIYSSEASRVTPLEVRVRFLQHGLPEDERRMVLRACRGFLDRYLVANPVEAYKLVEWTCDANTYCA